MIQVAYNKPELINTDEARQLWFYELKDIPGDVAMLAAERHIQTEKFPPTIADIRKHSAEILKREDMSEIEAWGYVRKAVNNGLYGYLEEFERLPKDIQKTIRHPETLREWAQLDPSEVETVVQSNFMRSYRATISSIRTDRLLSQSALERIMAMKPEELPPPEIPRIEPPPMEEKRDIPDWVVEELRKLNAGG